MSRCSDDHSDTCVVQIVDSDAVARVLGVQPSEQQVRTIAGIFAALSDATRLRILLALSREQLCVCDLAAVTGVSASAVSHQLRVLRDRDLVTFERDGKRAIYRLADDHVATLLAQGREHAEEQS